MNATGTCKHCGCRIYKTLSFTRWIHAAFGYARCLEGTAATFAEPK